VDSLVVDVFDSQADPIVLDSLAELPVLKNADLLLGPLYGRFALQLDAQWKGEQRSPILFSPLSPNLSAGRSASLVDLHPGKGQNLKRIADYISLLGDSITLCAAGTGSPAESRIRDSLKVLLSDSVHVRWKEAFWTPEEEKGFVWADQLAPFYKGFPLVVIHFSESPSDVADLLQKMNSIEDSTLLVSVHEWPSNLQQRFRYLNKLGVAFPQSFYVDYQREAVQDFVRVYRERFLAEPDIFSFHAHDCIWAMYRMWINGFGSDQYLFKGLQTKFTIVRTEGKWTNRGGGLLYMRDYQWIRSD
jgi:hypothetical protein